MVDAIQALQHLAAMARAQGRPKIEAVCLLALARLEELEAALVLAKARGSRGGQQRAQNLTADRRRAIAQSAASRRWMLAASIETEQRFTPEST